MLLLRAVRLSCALGSRGATVAAGGLAMGGGGRRRVGFGGPLLSTSPPDSLSGFLNRIKHACLQKHLDDALQCLAEMTAAEMTPDAVSFELLLSSCHEHGRLPDADAVADQMLRARVPPSPEACGSMVRAHLEAEQADCGKEFVVRMLALPGPKEETAGAVQEVVNAYLSLDKWVELIMAVKEMKGLGAVFSDNCLVAIVSAMARLRCTGTGLALVRALELKTRPDLLHMLVEGYVAAGAPQLGEFHLFRLATRGLVPLPETWSLLFQAFIEAGDMERIAMMRKTLKKLKTEPSLADYLAIFAAYVAARDLRALGEVSTAMLQAGHTVQVQECVLMQEKAGLRVKPEFKDDLKGAYVRIIKASCQRGDMAEASFHLQALFQIGVFPDLPIIDVILKGHKEAGNVEGAMAIWNQFVGHLEFDSRCITHLIELHSDHGDVGQALFFSKYMVTNHLEPSTRAMNALIRCYCRADRLDEARKLLGKLVHPSSVVQPDIVSFFVLISAFCHRHMLTEASQILQMLIKVRTRIPIDEEVLYPFFKSHSLSRQQNALESIKNLCVFAEAHDIPISQKCLKLIDYVIGRSSREARAAMPPEFVEKYLLTPRTSSKNLPTRILQKKEEKEQGGKKQNKRTF
ncbi:MAG: pentatricopeptide repeat-containing protein [archaeon]|nr:pentatricopeptide repeat-containing protein [archaeon]